MRFSLAATFIALSVYSASVRADSISDAMNMFCGGLEVVSPTENDVVVVGHQSTITVTRVPNDYKKNITGLDLYTVDPNGTPRYVQNTWKGKYTLETKASLSDTIPASVSPGFYYHRVWITNLMKDGEHGPDCIKLSRTFKVTSGSHTNENGFTSYSEALDDVNYYKPDFARGCFGVEITEPKENSVHKSGEHVSIVINRDSASQTDSITKIELYKASEGPDRLISVAWSGLSSLSDIFIVKDQLTINAEEHDQEDLYYYKIDVNSQVKGEVCSFQSRTFKIST